MIDIYWLNAYNLNSIQKIPSVVSQSKHFDFTVHYHLNQHAQFESWHYKKYFQLNAYFQNVQNLSMFPLSWFSHP